MLLSTEARSMDDSIKDDTFIYWAQGHKGEN